MAKTANQAKPGENGECGKNLPWVWQIFKSGAKRGPLESGDLIDKNCKHDYRKICPKCYAI